MENAVKFSAHGDVVRVKISANMVEENLQNNSGNGGDMRALLSVVVIDNGIGFKEQDHEKLFKPFVRLSDSR